MEIFSFRWDDDRLTIPRHSGQNKGQQDCKSFVCLEHDDINQTTVKHLIILRSKDFVNLNLRWQNPKTTAKSDSIEKKLSTPFPSNINVILIHPVSIAKVLFVDYPVDVQLRHRLLDNTKKGCPEKGQPFKVFMPERSGHLEQHHIGPFIRRPE